MALSPTSSRGGLVSSAAVTLTDAQIKALPTTPVVVIPATQSPNFAANLTEVPVIVGGLMLANNYAVAYSNVDAASTLMPCLGTDPNPWGPVAAPQPVFVTGGDAMAQLIGGPFVATPGPYLAPFAWAYQHNWADNAVRLVMDNQGAGVLTGGDPTNTLRVTLLYSVVALT